MQTQVKPKQHVFFEGSNIGCDGVMPLTIQGNSVLVLGGPYRQAPFDLIPTYNMAKEIPNPATHRLPIADFSVPTVEEAVPVVAYALMDLMSTGYIYVGCMGGIGRTGLFMGLLAEYAKIHGMQTVGALGGTVPYVRAFYKSYAIETDLQQEFIANFDYDAVHEMVIKLKSLSGEPVMPEVVYPELSFMEKLRVKLFHYFRKLMRSFN